MMHDPDREELVGAYSASQAAYDKAILTLSGGAIGVSVAVVEGVAGGAPVANLAPLAWSWGFWSGSLLCALISFLTSAQAIRLAIEQVDSGVEGALGGCWARVTTGLNVLGCLLFMLGLWTFFSLIHTLMETPDG